MFDVLAQVFVYFPNLDYPDVTALKMGYFLEVAHL